ncbi:tetratricopeptide repeat protein [Priestia megaterium]
MEPMTLSSLFKLIGGQFFSYMLPRIKNSKSFRDMKEKWVKDNYTLKTTLMFKAAVDDSTAAIPLSEDLVHALLNDQTNREEIFRWILEGISSDKFDRSRLNLEPYFESFPQYQDLIAPFFEMILINMNGYKEKHWDPEFLQLMYKIDHLEETTKKGFENVSKNQIQTIQIAKENNSLLKEVLSSPDFKDLNELIKLEKINSAREKALDRLKNKHLEHKDILELNAIIANTYMANGDNRKSIQYLYTCITYCDNDARKKRLEALINIFENRLEQAMSSIQEAIQIENYTKSNIEILLNIYFIQKEYSGALKIIEDYPKEDFSKLKARILLASKDFNSVTELAEFHLQDEPDNIDWLMLKSEAALLQLENNIENNIMVDPRNLFKEVMPLLNKIEGNEIENQGILMRIKEIKAAIYFRNKNYSEAKILYEEINRLNGDSSSFHLRNLLICCYCDNDWEKAIVILEEKNSRGNPELDDINDLAKMYVEIGKTDDAINLLNSNKTKFPFKDKIPIDYYFSYVDALSLSLKHNEITNMINLLEKETLDLTGLKLLKGYYAIKIYDWKEAITQLEACLNITDKNQLTQVKILLSFAYLNSETTDDYRKLKALLPTIPNWSQHDFLVNRYAKALFELGEYEKVISLSDQVQEKTTILLEIISSIYFDLGWYELAQENYLTLYQSTKELNYQLRYAHCLFRLGSVDECLNALTSAEVRVKKSGNAQDFSLLSISFMNAMEYRKSMAYAYQTYITGNKDPEAWRFFFSQMIQLDRFVDDPEPEWIQEFQKLFVKFNEEFPHEEPLGKQVQAIDNDKIASELIEEMKMVRESSEKIMTEFQKNKLPLSILSNLLNRGPFETWGYVTNESDQNIWIMNGTQQEIFQGAIHSGLTKNILCDITTLFTIHHLGLLDKLTKWYNIYIFQDQYDRLYSEYLQAKLISNQALKTAIYHEGRIVMHETPVEQLKESLNNQKEVVEWINNNCKKVGNIIKNDVEIGNEGKIDKDRIDFFISPIEVCEVNYYSMLVDSLLTRDFAKENHGVICFNSLDFLTLLLSEKEIDKDIYYQALGKLMMMGYSLIPVNKDVFVFFLKKNNYKITSEILTLFDYLKKEEFNEQFLLNLSSELLSWVWNENLSEDERQKITECVCIALTTNKSKSEIIPALIEDSKLKFSAFPKDRWKEIKNYIEQWMIS